MVQGRFLNEARLDPLGVNSPGPPPQQHSDLPFETSQIASKRDHKALNCGTLGGAGLKVSSYI